MMDPSGLQAPWTRRGLSITDYAFAIVGPIIHLLDYSKARVAWEGQPWVFANRALTSGWLRVTTPETIERILLRIPASVVGKDTLQIVLAGKPVERLSEPERDTVIGALSALRQFPDILRDLQTEAFHERIFAPAQSLAEELGMTSPLGILLAACSVHAGDVLVARGSLVRPTNTPVPYALWLAHHASVLKERNRPFHAHDFLQDLVKDNNTSVDLTHRAAQKAEPYILGDASGAVNNIDEAAVFGPANNV